MVPVATPHNPVLCASTLPAATPATHLLTLTHNHFVHADRNSLEVWETHYYTCQHQVDVAIPSDAKVRQLSCCCRGVMAAVVVLWWA